MPRDHFQGTWQEIRSFSPAVATVGGRMLWLAGEVGLVHEDTELTTETTSLTGLQLAEGFEAQVRCIFRRLQATLERAGGGLEDIVTMTVFLTHPSQGKRFVEIRSEYFPSGQYPASALIVVSEFPLPGILLEVQGMAVIGAA